MQSHSTAECPEKPVEFVEYVGFTKKLDFKLQNFGLQKEREVVVVEIGCFQMTWFEENYLKKTVKEKITYWKVSSGRQKFRNSRKRMGKIKMPLLGYL